MKFPNRVPNSTELIWQCIWMAYFIAVTIQFGCERYWVYFALAGICSLTAAYELELLAKKIWPKLLRGRRN